MMRHYPRVAPSVPPAAKAGTLPGTLHARMAAAFIPFQVLVFAFLAALPLAAQETDPATLKSRAYELYQQQKLPEAAEQFKAYVEKAPDDARATLDYAQLLSQLGRTVDAVRVLETMRTRFPNHEGAQFRLGVEYVTLERFAEAEAVFNRLKESANAEMAASATEALAKMQRDLARAARARAEQRVFALAGEFRHAEVVAAVNVLEKDGELSFPLEMQRLHSWSSLKEFALALERANALQAKHPGSTELALLRADIFAQQGRKMEAAAIWRQIIAQHPTTPAAAEADRRLRIEATEPPPPPTPAEEKVYTLARQQRHREVIDAIDAMEKEGPLPWAMELQRLYAWQGAGDGDRAIERAAQLALTNPEAKDLALLQSDLLLNARRWEEASAILKRLKRENPDTPIAEEAQKRLEYIPAIANLDKWNWGEAYLSGDWHDRWGTLIGSGFIRSGTYIPHARWAQPYLEFRFSVDTESDISTDRQTIITDNFVGGFAGVRVQPFETEYFFLYAQAGTSTDLFDQRNDGDWIFDYQVGLYGYKSWGPGVNLYRSPPDTSPNYTNYNLALEGAKGSQATDLFFWRNDGWVDAGADFSWYGRYDSWIGYGQAREGLRLFQYGPNIGFDVYLLEGISWDVRGNYFDNLAEIGPGARVLWTPRKNWQVVARIEFVEGWYLGRDELDNRGSASSHYDDLRAGLSVGVRW